MIIEPDHVLSANLKKFFKRAGFLVSVHADPQAALSTADQLRPDLVITELQLAGRSGVEFLYEFRSYPDWQDTPLIIFTRLNSGQIAKHDEVLTDLNISACLYKSETGLPDLLEKVRQMQPAHAKI